MEFLEGALEWAKDHLGTWTLVKAYIACAAAGGTVLLGQAGLNLFGLGGDVDVDADVDADALDAGDGSVQFLSVRTMASFLTLFGLVGWAGTAYGWGTVPTAAAALASGSSVMILVAYLLATFRKLQSQGNLDPRRAVGSSAQVYLRIPEKGAGQGKITVALQGRTAEFAAVSSGPELATGSTCRIVDMTTADTFVVEPL